MNICLKPITALVFSHLLRGPYLVWRRNNSLPFFFFPPHYPQCPFIDENILALHNKIRTKPVEFPERWVHFLHPSRMLHFPAAWTSAACSLFCQSRRRNNSIFFYLEGLANVTFLEENRCYNTDGGDRGCGLSYVVYCFRCLLSNMAVFVLLAVLAASPRLCSPFQCHYSQDFSN